jgi:ribonucleotide reductase alpha subunit
MAVGRGIYVDQSQSMNLYITDPSYKVLTSMHFYSWEQGLKTGSYYIRAKIKAKAQQFSIEPEFKKNEENKKNMVCTDEVCTVCSS